MSKEQKSNREKKKPKKDKIAAGAKPGMPNIGSGSGKK